MAIRPDKNGNLWDDSTNPPTYVGPAQPQSRVVPSNPVLVAKQQAEAERQARQEARADAVAARQAAKDARDAADVNKPKLPAGYMMAPDGKSAMLIPGVAAPGANAGGKTDKAGAYNSVIDQINRTYELYNQSIGTTDGLAGLMDYLPTEANAMFDTAGAALGDQGNAAFKVPGMGAQSDADAARFVAANQPQASDRDGAALEKLRALRQRLEANMGAVGLPAPQFNFDLNGQPIQQDRQDHMAVGAMPAQGNGPDQSNRDAVLFGGPGDQGGGGGFAAYGSTSRSAPNPQWAGVNEAVKGMIIAGRPAQEIKGFLNSKGIAGDATKGVDEALRYYQKTGRPDFGVDVENMSVPMSGTEQFMNNAPQTRVGTFLAQAGNAGGMGIPQMLAGSEGFDYLRSQNPGYSFAGDVAGVIGGTAALGGAGRAIAGKVAPNLLGGGGRAALGRGLATDATYGGIYGGTTEGDPLTGAATAAIGSGLGMGIGKGFQKAFAGGGDLAAQALRERGIPLTLGQAMGGMSKRIEDGATSIPFIGDMINNRRTEGLQAFNRVAFQDGGAPIGAQVNDIGEAGMDALRPQVSRSYDTATQNVNAPLDRQYATDLAPNLQQGSALVGDYGAGFSRLVNNRVKPALDSGELSGENYQNMMRAMRDSRGSVKGQPFAEDYIQPVKGMEEATRALMMRQGGEKVIAGLSRADEAYRNSKVLGNAVAAAKNTDGMFMPSQLNNASSQNAAKFGGNAATENRPFRDLAMNGQAVLPSRMADSGTPFRMGIGGVGLTGLTGGAAYATDGNPTATAAPLATASLLALLGTKQGQKLLVSGLMDRSDWSKGIGKMIGSRKGQRAISGAGAGLLLAGE